MSGLVLRPYQVDAIEALRSSYRAGRRAPLFQLATGGGKTIVFGAITRSAAAKGNRVLIAVHRRELLQQASAKLEWAGVEHGIIAAGFEPDLDHLVQVASVQTVIRRLGQLGKFDLVVLDECHRAVAGSWRRLIGSQQQAKLLGVTATPPRLDGKGLGIDCGGFFDDLVCGPSIAELVKGGFLSKARYFVPKQELDLYSVRTRAGDWVASEVAERVDRKAITGDAVEQYRRHADHQPAIAFCALVSHAAHVAAEFQAAGYRAVCVHGDLRKDDRHRLIAGLGTGEVEVLTSCDLISEGLDVPALGAVILLRPTQSLVLHMQQIGRGMRPAEGKKHVAVLDHAGNIKRHGRPDIERIWTLGGVEEKAGTAIDKVCPDCGCLNPPAVRECENCGFVWEIGEPRGGRRTPVYVPGSLGRLSASRLSAILGMSYRQVTSMRLSEEELKAYAEVHGYKPGWVFHRLREQRRTSL
jgi:superfamily II DNA or RNA helicase